MQWIKDLHSSMAAFDKYVLPVLPKLIIGDVVKVEGTDEEIAKILDQQIGIDLLINQNGVYSGIASRIQIDSGVWKTFTIRCGRCTGHITEFEKLQTAIKNDAMRPHYTLQAYVTKEKLQAVAIMRTRDLIDFINKYRSMVIKKDSIEGTSWAEFMAIKWCDIKRSGYRIRELNFEED